MADINDRLRADWSVPLTASTSISDLLKATNEAFDTRCLNPHCVECNGAPTIRVDSFKVTDSAGNVLLEHNAPREPGPSRTTQQLIDMLVSRDAAGRAKYGTSLDRTDLSADDWAQHMLEELLDAAGYLVRLREVLAARALR